MKQTITILSIGLIFFASCKKVPKCWDCTRTITKVKNNEKGIINSRLCDKTKVEIMEYQKANTTYKSTPYTLSVVTECH